MSRIRLIDVAKHAGVSRATASLALRDSPLVADATRERVRESMPVVQLVHRVAGKEVPEDLLAAAFDDIAEARYSSPSLTSVASSGELTGSEAARLLTRRLADPQAHPEQLLVPTTLVTPASCGCASISSPEND